MHYGVLEDISEIEIHFPIHPYPEGLEYVLMKSTIGVDVGGPNNVPHEYWSWYGEYHDGRREGPMPEGDVPLFVLEEAFGKGTTDPKDRAVVDAKDPKLEGVLDSPVYSDVSSNWSVEGVVESEDEEPEEELEEEDPEEEPNEESEEDPEDDRKYDSDED
ncbi:hypothetical protein ACJRO7_016744 [Eucalyptus globulus]|uniref:Uncharacterized protein n=1 Tax=Eucalyptus globulus TaxID=34317 RepID=A0ABD3L8W4_EUCGL